MKHEESFENFFKLDVDNNDLLTLNKRNFMIEKEMSELYAERPEFFRFIYENYDQFAKLLNGDSAYFEQFSGLENSLLTENKPEINEVNACLRFDCNYFKHAEENHG